MQTAKSILITGFIIAFSLTSLVSYADDIPEVIILFDQSGSMKKWDTKLRSKECLGLFSRTIVRPCGIVLAGFDDAIHEHVNVVIRTETDMDALAQRIAEIDVRSFCTDLETPFKYLIERERAEAVKFVLIVSDGEPEIWDPRLRYFSRRIKSDSRYEKLNRQYRALKASRLSPDELYDRLGHLYHERNIELIEEQVSRLRGGLGDRIVLWDISGESRLLRGWAQECGAQYVPVKPEEDARPIDHLITAMLSVWKELGSFVHEPPVQAHQTRSESASPVHPSLEQKPQIAPEPKPEIRPEPKPKPEVAHDQKPGTRQTIVTSEPPSPESDHEPERPAELIQKQASEDRPRGWTTYTALALFVLVGMCSIVIIRRSRKKARARAHTQLADEEWQRLTGTKNDQEKLKDLVSASIKEASDYVSNYISSHIDDEIRQTTREVEKLLDELMKGGGQALESYSQFPIRTCVPPGAMQIHWTSEDGKKMSGQAVDISMDAVLFEAPGFNAESIDKVFCPSLNLVFDIKRSSIHRKDGDIAIAVLEEFHGGVDDSMKWVEIFARIDEGK